MKKNLHIKVFERFNLLIAFALFATFFSCSQKEIFEEEIMNADEEFVVASLTSSAVQAENYDAQNGIQIAGGGSKVGYIQNGDWIRFDDFDFDGANSVSVRAASKRSGGTIEFRAGGTGGDLLGTVSVTNTGGWNNMQTFTANMNDNSNNSDLYLVFKGGSGYLFDVDSFTLSGNDDNGSCNLPWSDNGFVLAKGTQAYRKTVDISCESNVTLSLTAEGAGNMESADYMNIYYKVNGGSQQTIYTKNDSFSERSFTVENIQGNTLEIIVDAKNSASNEIHTLSNVRVSTDVAPPPPPTGDSAADIIGSGWKLNGYTGNLNVSSNNNGLTYADNASTAESHFFFEKDGYAAFRCYAGNPTSSSGTDNPRSELREIINGGSNYWDGTTGTQRSMKMRFKIEDLPPSGKLAFMQIHERVDPFDDVVRIQVQGSAGQNSGSVTLRINGYVTEDIEGQGRSVDFDMQMDTEYYFELTMQRGVVTLYNLNNSGNRIETLFQSVDIGDADENYFKAGCYLQSTSSSHYSSNVYGQVLIKDLVVNPND